MDIKVKLKGHQTETHCSISSSIGACEKLNIDSGNCLMFKQKLEYDFEAHAYKREFMRSKREEE